MAQVRRMAPASAVSAGRAQELGAGQSAPVTRRRRRRVLRVIEALIWLVSLTVICTVVFAAYLVVSGQSASAPRLAQFANVMLTQNPFAARKVLHETGGKATILILGTDETNNLCDTAILAFVNENTKRVGLISLPRDARVQIPDNGWDKLAHAVPYGMEQFRSMDRAIALVRRTIEQNFHIPIDYFVRIDVKAFQELVDLIGGVKIDVEKDMHYTDREQALYINLTKGVHVLNGHDAMGYVRFRNDPEGDKGRMRRQQHFLEELAAQLGAKLEAGSIINPHKAITLGKLAAIATEYCDTDLTADQIVGLAKMAREIDLAGIETREVPWRDCPIGGIYYLQVDAQGLLAAVSDLKAAIGSEKAPALMAKVSVLNGCGVSGLAADVGQMLEDQGLQIVEVGNYGRQDLVESVIRHAPGFEETAEFVQTALAPSTFKTVEDPNLQGKEHNVEVILGRSYSTHHLP